LAVRLKDKLACCKASTLEDRKAGRQEGWRLEGLTGWKAGVKGWKFRSLEFWKVGRLEGWKAF
jgi:hypothetical protein